jgi:DNA-binding SARP family transcriptional activator/streptogramin lyase
MPIEISLLGPVEVARDGQQADLGSPQQRVLMALLALRAGRLTPVGTIVDALWPSNPPPSAAKVVQTYVSRLRKAIGADAIKSRDGGYVLDVPHDAVDAVRFEQLVAAARFSDALRLWRGPPLAGLEALGAEAERLDELRRRAIEDRLDEQLAAGWHADVVSEARALLAEDPLRERAVAQLMLALYRSGRQADALQVYRDTRRRFSDELGLEPGPELRALERRILGHDSALAAPRRRAFAGRSRRLQIVAAAAVVAAMAGIAVAFATRGTAPPPLVLRPHTIVRIDAKTNRIVESIRVGREPAAIVAAKDAVWVANERDATLTRVDLDTHQSQTIGGVENVAFLTRDNRGNIYASAWDYPFVWRIAPRNLEVVERYRVRTRALGLAVGGGSLWVADRLANSVTRIDLARGSVQDVIAVGTDPLVLAFGYGAVWVANSDYGSVSVIRPGVSRVETITGITKPFGIAAGAGAVWVGSNDSSTVTRIDPDTRRIVKTISVTKDGLSPSGLFDVAVGAGAVWAANRGERSIVRIDPRTNKVVARIRTRYEPRAIAAAGDAVWVSVGTPGYDG